jgi:chemotaxis protein CheD
MIYPGDHYVTKDRCLLSTIVGSCVVVCLHEPHLKIGGLGHFIVPGMIGTEGLVRSEIAEHGIVNLEYLMAEVVKLGGDRKNLVAKIFGAGFTHEVNSAIIKSNINFLKDYFAFENIPIEKEDLGGKFRREVIFNPVTGEVFRKILKHNSAHSEFDRLEKEYIEKTFLGKEIKTHYVLFE